MKKNLTIVEYIAEPYDNGFAEHDIKVFAELRFALTAINEERNIPRSADGIGMPTFVIGNYDNGMVLRPVGETHEGQWKEFRITFQDVDNL